MTHEESSKLGLIGMKMQTLKRKVPDYIKPSVEELVRDLFAVMCDIELPGEPTPSELLLNETNS